MTDESGAALSIQKAPQPKAGQRKVVLMPRVPVIGCPSGSEWRRWDPHLHAPGTLLNDQFAGNWDGYLTALETAEPPVQVLGITDYFSIGSYRQVREYRAAGRLSNVKLIFPNVEMRLDVATEKKRSINIHLLFSPDDDDHEAQIERVLADLEFEYGGRKYRCTATDLAALGRAHNPRQTDEAAARCEGANQFKVSLGQLRQFFRSDTWVHQNCIVAVSGSSNDGTAGVQKDASFAAWRMEVERFAQVVFSPNAGSRDFWLGKHPSHPREAIERDYGSRKVCLHGCDAHCVAKTPVPDDERFCWVKGDPSFESLRQAILEPDERVHIGREPLDRYDARMCIAQVNTSLTPWLTCGPIPLNPGLVAIIGSRGSGQTALADMLAAGAGASAPHRVETSFLCRAAHHLHNGLVELRWGDGTAEVWRLCPDHGDLEVEGAENVQYLSQQFVEQLCSAEGLAVELRKEIERVIFEATSPTDRYDADSFDQLAEIHLAPIRETRGSIQEAIELTSSQVLEEDALGLRVEPIEKEITQLEKRIAQAKQEMLSLTPKGKEDRAKRLAELEAAATTLSVTVDKQKRVLVRVQDLKKEVVRLRSTAFVQLQARLKSEYTEVGLSEAAWVEFAPKFDGSPERVLHDRTAEVEGVIRVMLDGDPDKPFDPATTPLRGWPLTALLKERDQVKAEVGIDAQKQRRYADLQRGLEKDERTLQRLRGELQHARGAAGRRNTLVERRRAHYQDVFDTYLQEREVLERLYKPLQQHLESAEGSLSRLRFSVSREIDLKAWVDAGETLFDLRKESRIRGHGALLREADSLLHATWKFGTAQAVSEAMQKFIRELYPEFKKSIPSTVTPNDETEWMQRVAAWLYSTHHVKLRYSITYDGVAIEHLSPGTRGIVLLMLYLVIDRHDQRPLIIDQPEENLDPKSVFEELVPHFREARKRRQVIIVTHNANLVVNTDADQVIVASAERREGHGLPQVHYQCGSIENPEIRRAVCDILEGGERAFLDREKRYRLIWERRK